jgi:hypothetical protein
MPPTLLITNEQAINRCTLYQAQSINYKIRLCENFVPTATTTRAQLLAAEANFSGYPAGGYPAYNWSGVYAVPTGGAYIQSPQVQVAPNEVLGAPVNVTAFWIDANETALPNGTNVANIAMLTGVFNPAVSMQYPTDGFPLAVPDFEGIPSTITIT